MKNLITILILLVAAGCSKTENATVTEPETETGKTEPKPLSREEQKLVGSYEWVWGCLLFSAIQYIRTATQRGIPNKAGIPLPIRPMKEAPL